MNRKDNKKKRKQGRPTEYTEQIGESFISLISQGNSVVFCCKELGVSRQSFYNWLAQEHVTKTKDGKSFMDRYREAKNISYESYFDNAEDEVITLYNKLLNNGVDKNHIAIMVKTITDTKKWTAERLMPNRFGNKIEETEHIIPNIIELDVGDVSLSKK